MLYISEFHCQLIWQKGGRVDAENEAIALVGVFRGLEYGAETMFTAERDLAPG